VVQARLFLAATLASALVVRPALAQPPPDIPWGPAPPAAPWQAPPAFEPPPSPPPPWTSGYHNGNFFLRSSDDIFRLYVQGRVHADFYDAFGPHLAGLPPGGAVAQGFSLRRARLELAGEFFQQWQWQLGAEFAPSAADNVAATSGALACKPDATGALACNPQESPVDNPTAKPAPTDAFVNYAPTPWANVQVGQYYLPFSLENRISDNTTAFLERALVIRTIAAPLQRDIGAMLWGESPNGLLYYAVGVFNGDGPNRPNPDGRFDVAGRALVRPLAGSTRGHARWAQLGASVHAGSRDPAKVGYDVPALTTSEGFTFWKPTYTDSAGNLVHILPSAQQLAVGGDVYFPVGDFDFTGEVVYARYETREAVDGFQLAAQSARLGALEGFGWYAQASYWVIGDHDVVGFPSYGRPIHVDLSQPERRAVHGVQLVARVDQLALKYSGASRGGADDSKTPTGDVKANSFTLGVSYWATRHLRVSVNYGYYDLPGRSAVPTLHELSGRVGVQF
jgi:hypothetical protein